MTIRTTLEPGDLSFLLSTHAEFYLREHDYTVPFEYVVGKAITEFYEAYQRGRSCIWIPEVDGERQGSLVLQERGSVAQLRFFLLQPETQGKGIGKELLRLFIAFCKANAFESAYLWTTGEQAVAGKLYRSFGFRVVEERASETFGRPTVEQRYEVVF